MFEAQFSGVQRESWCSAAIDDQLLAERAAIVFVAADRMPRLGKMNANLMRATSFESAFNEREAADQFDWSNVRDCLLALIGIGNAASFSVAAIASEKRFNCLLADFTEHDRQIRAVDRVLAKLLDK